MITTQPAKEAYEAANGKPEDLVRYAAPKIPVSYEGRIIPMEKEKEISSKLAGKKTDEVVVPEKGHKIHSTHIRHHDGGHHVVHYHEKGSTEHHVPHGPGGPGDLDNLHAHMEHMLGTPNVGESELPEGIIQHNPMGGAANLEPHPGDGAPAAV